MAVILDLGFTILQKMQVKCMSSLSLDGHKLTYHPDRVADFAAGLEVAPIYVEISGCKLQS